jgi:hypothetical protein
MYLWARNKGAHARRSSIRLLLVRTDKRTPIAGVEQKVLNLAGLRRGIGTTTCEISLGSKLGEKRKGLILSERARQRWRWWGVEMSRLHRRSLGGLSSSLSSFVWYTNDEGDVVYTTSGINSH